MIHINQYNKGKQKEEKKEVVDKKILDVSGLVNTAVLNTKVGKVETEMPEIAEFSDLVKKTDYNTEV